MQPSRLTTTVISLLATSALMARPVMAEMLPQRVAPTNRAEQQERKMERQTVITDARKANAGKEIDRRVAAMTALITRVNNLKKISAEQKASLVAQLQTAISDLTALKAKIAADTDAATLQADKQSIVISYRVFTSLMPKVEILAHANAMLETIDEMNAATTAFQKELTASGKDTSAIKTLMTDRQTKITTTTTQIQNLIKEVSSVSPTDYPNSKTVLQNARQTLAQGRKDLRSAYQDLKQANQALKALK